MPCHYNSAKIKRANSLHRAGSRLGEQVGSPCIQKTSGAKLNVSHSAKPKGRTWDGDQ